MPYTQDNRTVLTVQQPWADWIVDGHKDVENRTWSTPYRGRLYIHAAKKEDAGAWWWVENTMGKTKVQEITSGDEQHRGAIIGHVDLIDCVQFSTSPWWTGSWAWVLANAKRITPEPCRGYLGLWTAGNAKPTKP